MDDLLFPKIADFGLSKKKIHNKNSITAQSETGIKGTFAYIAPEVFETKNQSESSDVYAFGQLILYELLTTNIPFKNMDAFQIYREVVINGHRPLFESPIDPAYRDLIERCWSQDPNNRPTFSKIVDELETNHDFILPSVDEYDYLDYANFIKESQISFKKKKIIKLEDFVRHPESSSFRKVDISRYLDKDEQSIFFFIFH